MSFHRLHDRANCTQGILDVLTTRRRQRLRVATIKGRKLLVGQAPITTLSRESGLFLREDDKPVYLLA
jgi:hypothetical protein